ncbi:MAG TPA: hypothetical protein VF678_07910 [bacterium]
MSIQPSAELLNAWASRSAMGGVMRVWPFTNWDTALRDIPNASANWVTVSSSGSM